MFRIVTLVVAVVLVAGTVHATVAGSASGPASRGALAVLVLAVLGLGFYLGRRFSWAKATAEASARAEARAAAMAAARSRAAAQSNVIVNVGDGAALVERTQYRDFELEDSFADEVELVEDAGEDLAVQGAQARERGALPASTAPSSAALAFEQFAAEKLRAHESATRKGGAS